MVPRALQDSQGHQALRECRGNPVLLVPRALQDFPGLLVCLDRKESRKIVVPLVVEELQEQHANTIRQDFPHNVVPLAGPALQATPDLLVYPGREASREAVVLTDTQGFQAHLECPGNPVLLAPRALQDQLAFLDL